jgi:UDP-2,3-diacylglucosamine hydrolase
MQASVTPGKYLPSLRAGRTVSDLHILARRTAVEKHMPSIRQAAGEADLFVLNGDIFDFRWSVRVGMHASIAAAEEWIHNLATDFPSCRFVYVLGNHDHIPLYMAMLERLSGSLGNLAWEEYIYRLGPKVFAHGDAFHGSGRSPELLRVRRAREHRQRGVVLNAMYDAFVGSGLHRAIPHLIPKRLFVRRVSRYLHAALGEGCDDVRDVYLGHLHKAFRDLEFGGMRFHNTGAAIDGVRLHILPFEFDLSELHAGGRP